MNNIEGSILLACALSLIICLYPILIVRTLLATVGEYSWLVSAIQSYRILLAKFTK
jgi:hypothetical protein